MKFLLRFFLLTLFLPSLVGAAPNESIAIVHVTVIDGTGRSPQSDQTVLIEGKRIAAIGPSGRVKFPKTARIVDGSGKFLIPGLWDMHTHLAGVLADPTWSKDVLLPLLLVNGITGVRDMGGDLEALLAWKRDVEAGTLLGPHIVAAGPWLAGRGKKTPEQYPVANADEARAAVRELKQRGADFIKVLTTPSREVFFAIADEAKKQNITFAGHLPFDVSAAEASNAGMHSIEHLYYSAFALSVSSKEEELRQQLHEAAKKGDFEAGARLTSEVIASYSPEKAAALWRTLKANNTWVTPTLEGIYAASHPMAFEPNDAALLSIPESVRKDWHLGVSEDPTANARKKMLAKLAENDWKLTGEMHAAGVSLLVGSDSLDEGVIPGVSLHAELRQFVKAGFKPMEALQAATAGAAKFLGRDNELGTIENGKRADLVLLNRDPLKDIANTTSIEAVVMSGTLLDRAALNQLQKKVQQAAAAVK